MRAPIDTQAMLDQWRDEPLEETPGSKALDHDAQIRGVARALGRVAERKARRSVQRKQWLSVAFAAGVFGLAAAGWQLAHEPGASRAVAVVRVEGASPGEVWSRDRKGVRRAPEPALAPGDGLETGVGEAKLGFPSGATAQLSQQSRVEVIRAAGGEAFLLAAGAVEVEVPKLGSGQFSVQTADALVVVHGTHFSVSIEPGPVAHTRVDVSRGLVSVESQGEQIWLSAGQHWPAEAPSPTPTPVPAPRAADAGSSAPAPAATSAVAADPASPAQAPEVADTEPPARKSTGSLALRRQNRSFARAMDLKKRDEPGAALAELERLARRYPRSVLKQEIRVEHFRLLTRLGRAREAAREARAYLGDYPHGYARQEARALALGTE
jgi:ferric-dicitrate binding protein FerR (iron transport regulator)